MNNFFPLKTVNLLVLLASHCDNVSYSTGSDSETKANYQSGGEPKPNQIKMFFVITNSL